jgi:single-stranded DNA-binding protein
MQMLDSRNAGSGGDYDSSREESPRAAPRANSPAAPAPGASSQPAPSDFNDFDDDIPF